MAPKPCDKSGNRRTKQTKGPCCSVGIGARAADSFHSGLVRPYRTSSDQATLAKQGVCVESTPHWDEGEAASRVPAPHPRRAAAGCALTRDPGETPASGRG